MNIADKNYYLDAEGNMVEEGSEEAATLLVGKGSEISKEMAEKYDFSKVTPQDGAEADSVQSDAKAEKPASNKKAAPSSNKGAK